MRLESYTITLPNEEPVNLPPLQVIGNYRDEFLVNFVHILDQRYTIYAEIFYDEGLRSYYMLGKNSQDEGGKGFFRIDLGDKIPTDGSITTEISLGDELISINISFKEGQTDMLRIKKLENSSLSQFSRESKKLVHKKDQRDQFETFLREALNKLIGEDHTVFELIIEYIRSANPILADKIKSTLKNGEISKLTLKYFKGVNLALVASSCYKELNSKISRLLGDEYFAKDKNDEAELKQIAAKISYIKSFEETIDNILTNTTRFSSTKESLDLDLLKRLANTEAGDFMPLQSVFGLAYRPAKHRYQDSGHKDLVVEVDLLGPAKEAFFEFKGLFHLTLPIIYNRIKNPGKSDVAVKQESEVDIDKMMKLIHTDLDDLRVGNEYVDFYVDEGDSIRISLSVFEKTGRQTLTEQMMREIAADLNLQDKQDVIFYFYKKPKIDSVQKVG